MHFNGNMFVIKDELDHFEEKFATNIQIFLLKRSDPDPVELFWIEIRIRPGQTVPDPTGSGHTTPPIDLLIVPVIC